MEKLLYQLEELKNKQRNRDFNTWLEKKTDDIENTENAEDIMSNKNVIQNYIWELKEFLNYNNYKIKNDKQFKDEIASYIYNNSN